MKLTIVADATSLPTPKRAWPTAKRLWPYFIAERLAERCGRPDIAGRCYAAGCKRGRQMIERGWRR